LKIKAQESQQRQHQEQEEMCMERLARERAIQLKESLQEGNDKGVVTARALSTDRPTNNRSNLVCNLLVHMHRGDDKIADGSRKANNKKMKKRVQFSAPAFLKCSQNKTVMKKTKTAHKSKKRSKY
jgi:hypothetical protein